MGETFSFDIKLIKKARYRVSLAVTRHRCQDWTGGGERPSSLVYLQEDHDWTSASCDPWPQFIPIRYWLVSDVQTGLWCAEHTSNTPKFSFKHTTPSLLVFIAVSLATFRPNMDIFTLYLLVSPMFLTSVEFSDIIISQSCVCLILSEIWGSHRSACSSPSHTNTKQLKPRNDHTNTKTHFPGGSQ